MPNIRIKETVTIGVHEGIKLVVEQQDGDPVIYEIFTPAFAQDDGMGGNIIVKCIANEMGNPDTLAYVGLQQEIGDFGETRESDDFLGETDGKVMGRNGVNFVRIAPSTI